MEKTIIFQFYTEDSEGFSQRVETMEMRLAVTSDEQLVEVGEDYKTVIEDEKGVKITSFDIAVQICTVMVHGSNCVVEG